MFKCCDSSDLPSHIAVQTCTKSFSSNSRQPDLLTALPRGHSDHLIQFPISAAHISVVLRQAHKRSVLSVGHLSKVAPEREPTFVLFKNDRFPPQSVEYLRPLLLCVVFLFDPDWCCDALTCPCSKISQASMLLCPAKSTIICDIFLSPSLLYSWMFEHDCLATCCFGCFTCMCICTCSVQLSNFNMERRSRNTIIIIILLLCLLCLPVYLPVHSL